MKNLLLVTTLIATCAFGTLVQGAEPRAQALPAPEDATTKTVLVGRNLADNLIVTFEMEAAKEMSLPTGNPPKLRQRAVRKGEIYHLDVKPLDPRSTAVISYEHVTFRLVNRTTGKKMSGVLHPMWDNGGLHYAANSPLAGDGAYELIVSVGAPTFGRAAEYKDQWLKPIVTRFHFKIVDRKIIEVSEPMVEARKYGEPRGSELPLQYLRGREEDRRALGGATQPGRGGGAFHGGAEAEEDPGADPVRYEGGG